MSRAPLIQRVCERLIRAACRRLPADMGAERCREWAAELPAVLDDQSIHPRVRRRLRALAYSAGIAITTRRLSSAGTEAPAGRTWQWRNGVIQTRPPDVAVRATIGFAAWLLVVFLAISLARAFPGPPGWLIILGVGLAAGFDALCLADIARAGRVRYLPKWAWALICLAQTPGGGIIYLSVGRVSRAAEPGVEG